MRTLLCILIVILIVLSGCVGTKQSVSPSQSSGSADYNSFSPTTKELSGVGTSGSTNDESSTHGPSVSPDQKVVITDDMHIEVSNATEALEKIRNIANEHNGYLSTSAISMSDANRRTGSAVVRIPSHEYSTARASLFGTGRVLSENEKADDVTLEYVDLDASINSLKNQISTYNRIMLNASAVEDVLKVQNELDRVQMELDRETGKMNYLKNRISFATLNVNFEEPLPIGTTGGPGFSEVLNTAVQGFIQMVQMIIIAFFTLLPLIILGILGYIVYRYWKKRSI